MQQCGTLQASVNLNDSVREWMGFIKYVFLQTVFEGLYLVLLDLFVFFAHSIHCDFTLVLARWMVCGNLSGCF